MNDIREFGFYVIENSNFGGIYRKIKEIRGKLGLRGRWCRESKKKKKKKEEGRKLELDKPAGPKKQFYTSVHGENWRKLEIG